ncbi:hypothetical protein GF359_00735 [candidate division WOR-3 bacterium]|uniref:Secreted protein n=1 Tax=candidate division WOR-3 bacterium TaxID=2052148 RepID=A0A9D5QBQ3_UNCW3|nr:hypothetical protein [candidate division WOR-3 bacterium]MBD3363719.1 hypothetical protein [candidate division WOR-3 bacterium]
MKKRLKTVIAITLISVCVMGVMVPLVASEHVSVTDVCGSDNLIDDGTDPIADTTDTSGDVGGGMPPPPDTLPPPEPPWD